MASYTIIVFNTLLASLMLLSCANFFAPFVCGVNETSSVINSWSLVISGFLINAGTGIQIIRNVVLKNNTLQFDYLTCLVSGCFLLFFGQLFTYVHKTIQDTDFLISLLGSFLSFAFTITLLAINKYNDSKRSIIGISLPKKIVYYEGTSGVGKTTMGKDRSYDLTNYTDKHPLFKLKQSLPYVQTMYMMQLYSDIILDLLEFSRNETTTTSFNDRHIFSQLVYDILFYHKGERTEPQEFRRSVDQAIFNNRNYVKLLRLSMRRVYIAVTSIAPNTDINIHWFVSGDARFTKQKLIDRGGFEARQSDWNLEWYVQNQNYIFRKLWQISEIGDMHVVKLI